MILKKFKQRLYLVGLSLTILTTTSFGQNGFWITTGTSLTISGDGSLTIEDSKLVNNGTFSVQTGTLTFTGTSESAKLEGSGQTNLQHLTINKSVNDFFLKKNIVISGNLTLNAGNLSLEAGSIDFGNTGKIINETEISRIYGNGGYLTVNANLNTPQNETPGNLGATITSTANFGLTTIRRTHVGNLVKNQSILRTYEIIPTNNTALNALLTLKYFNAELNGNAKKTLSVWKSEDGATSWKHLNSVNDSDKNLLQAFNVSSMGLFTGHVQCPEFSIQPISPLCERETLYLNVDNFNDNTTTYSWVGPNGFSSTSAMVLRNNLSVTDSGTYTLTATKNGCSVSATTNLTVYPLPSVPTLTADNMQICKGGIVVLTGTCSMSGASFRWLAPEFNRNQLLSSSNNRIVTEPGVYIGLCESKEGCLSEQVSISITQATDCNRQNFIVITPEKPAICPGQTITMIANGCNGTLSWTDGKTTTTGGTANLSPTVTTGYLVSCSTGGSASFQVVVATTNLAISNNVGTGKERFKAVQTLTSNKEVGSLNFTPGANVIYESGGTIILEPGFSVQKWSVFKAEIKTCN